MVRADTWSPIRRAIGMFSVVMSGVLATAFWAYAEEGAPQIKAENAKQFVGKQVTVVFTVQATKDATAHRGVMFLDSEKDFRSSKNLGISITKQGLADLRKKRGIESPDRHFLNKKIKVVGEVILREERLYIDVDRADAIKTIDEKEKG